MKKNSPSQFGIFNLRVLLALTLCSAGVLLAIFGFAGLPGQLVGHSVTSINTTGSFSDSEEVKRERDMPVAGPEGKRDDLNRIEEEWHNRLTYPTGKFDAAWVRKAAAQDSFIPRRIPAGIRKPSNINRGKNSPLALNVNSFTALGPQPERMTGCTGCFDYGTTEGRVNAIAVDPTTTTNGSIVAYIGTDGGGVWKTTNCCSGSTSWTVLTDDAAVSTTGIDSVTIDPNDHNTIYAGTGDLNYGSFSQGSQGILRSSDGGATWTVLGADVFGASFPLPPGTFPQYQAVGKVRVDPNNSNNVVAGTKTGLYFSYDAGTNWTGPCTTNALSTQRQDITGLELTNMGGGITRILAAVGVRGFATTVQVNLDKNGANGLYKGTMPASGCPSDFTLLTSNASGFVYSATAVSGSPYGAGANMNAGSGTPYGGTGTGTQLGRMDIAVAPSNSNYIYVQVGQIASNPNGGCGNTSGCQLGVWASIDGGISWNFMTGSAGQSLVNCTGGAGDYPQNWYDQGIAVDPNNPDRIFVDTFDTWLASRTGTSFYDLTCGYSGGNIVHVDQHALAFVPGSSSLLLKGSDGGVFSSSNADAAVIGTTRNTWVNMITGLNTIEFYAGDISGDFANSAEPHAVGGAQDNGPSSVKFSGTPTGPVQWQMGLGGDGFSGQIDPMGTGQTQAKGTITLTTGGAVAGETFVIGTQTFTFVASRTTTGEVTLNTSTTTEGNNIVTAINTDIPAIATASRTGATVIVTATVPGPAGNVIPFTESASNFAMNGGGFLGGTQQGGLPGSLRIWEGNNSGGLSRCISNCTVAGATWTSSRGSWTGDQQSFVLPINMFHGGIPGGDDCQAAGLTTGCGHLIAGTTRVWETISGAAASVPTSAWYITNNPAGAAGGPNLCKGTLGNRSFINQVKYSPKYQSVAIVGTNDGNVQIGFNLGTGTASQANWVNVTASNAILPNRPVLGIALDPSVPAANVPVGYAAVGGFDENTPSTPGHVFRVACDTNCASPTWQNKSGNLPNVPVDSIIVNPNFPQQVFAGTDFGLYYTDDITANSPVWFRFNNGLPNTMIWDMQIDRGSTTLSLWTRSRGAFVWPLPSSPVQSPTQLTKVASRKTHTGAGDFDVDLGLDGSGVECRSSGDGNYTVVFTFADTLMNVDSASIASGTAVIGSSGVGADAHEYIVNLTGVANQQRVTVTLNNIQDSANHFSTAASGTMPVLLGDIGNNGNVAGSDVNLCKAQVGVDLSTANFRSDINLTGSVTGSDVNVVKAQVGAALP